MIRCFEPPFQLRLPTSPRISIVKHRSFALFMLYLLFLTGLDPNRINLHVDSNATDEAICKVIGIAIHLSGLAVFSWTLLEGHQLYTSLQVHFKLFRWILYLIKLK